MTITGDDTSDFLETVGDAQQATDAQVADLANGALPPPLRWRVSRNSDGSFSVAIFNPSTGRSLSIGTA